MIKFIWGVICERVAFDYSNSLSLLNCIDEVLVNELPIEIPRLSLSTKWFNESDDIQSIKFLLTVVSPDGSERSPTGDMVADIKPLSSFRGNIVLDQMPIDQFGIYRFNLIFLNGDDRQLVAEIPLLIRKI